MIIDKKLIDLLRENKPEIPNFVYDKLEESAPIDLVEFMQKEDFSDWGIEEYYSIPSLFSFYENKGLEEFYEKGKNINKSNGVFTSLRVNDSNYVQDSTDIANSSNIDLSSFVINSEKVGDSNNVYYSKNVYGSERIRESENIYYSENIEASKFCYKSDNLANCYFCSYCSGLSNALFCSFLKFSKEENLQNYWIFNKIVTEKQFKEFVSVLENILTLDKSFSYDGRIKRINRNSLKMIETFPNYKETEFYPIFFENNK